MSGAPSGSRVKKGMNLFAALLSLVARVVLAVASLLLFLALLVVGLSVVLALVIWSLLRGRRPQLHTATFRRAGDFGARAFGTRRAPEGEVVDIEAREVGDEHAASAKPRLE